MTYFEIKKLFDKYINKNHPELEFYNAIEIKSCMSIYGKNFKRYLPYKNLYMRKYRMDMERELWLKNNPYIPNWRDIEETNEEILGKPSIIEEKETESVKETNTEKDAIICTSEMIGDKKIFKCTLDGCNRQYTSAFGLKYHIREGHSEEKLKIHKPYVCDVPGCGRKYKNNNGLKYHLKTFHGRNE